MTTIWKFPLHVTDDQWVEMPVGAKLLAFQTQRDALAIWAQVHPQMEKERRHFRIVGTGNPVPAAPEFCTQRYIGTTQQFPFVWHLYEVEHPA